MKNKGRKKLDSFLRLFCVGITCTALLAVGTFALVGSGIFDGVVKNTSYKNSESSQGVIDTGKTEDTGKTDDNGDNTGDNIGDNTGDNTGDNNEENQEKEHTRIIIDTKEDYDNLDNATLDAVDTDHTIIDILVREDIDDGTNGILSNQDDYTVEKEEVEGEDGEKIIYNKYSYNKGIFKVAYGEVLGFNARGIAQNISDLTISDETAGVEVTSIANEAFAYNKTLNSVSISGAIGKVGVYAFYDCTNLTSVEVGSGDSLISIGRCAFMDCENLTSIAFLKNVANIQVYAFKGCTNLNNIVIPNREQWMYGTPEYGVYEMDVNVVIDSTVSETSLYYNKEDKTNKVSIKLVSTSLEKALEWEGLNTKPAVAPIVSSNVIVLKNAVISVGNIMIGMTTMQEDEDVLYDRLVNNCDRDYLNCNTFVNEVDNAISDVVKDSFTEYFSTWFVDGAVVSDIDFMECLMGRSYSYVVKSDINKIEKNVFTKIDLSVFTDDMLEIITESGKITSDSLRFDNVVFEDTTSTWMYVDDDGVTRYFTPSTDASENAKLLQSLSNYTLTKVEEVVEL